MVLLIRVNLHPLDKYKRFQPANLLSIFSRIGCMGCIIYCNVEGASVCTLVYFLILDIINLNSQLF